MNLKFFLTVLAFVPVVLVVAWPILLLCPVAPRLAQAICDPIDDAVAWARR